MTNEEQLELIAQARELCEERIEGLSRQLTWQNIPEEIVEYSKLQLNSWTTHLAEMDEHKNYRGLCDSCDNGVGGVLYPCDFLVTKAKRLLGVSDGNADAMD